MDNLKKWLNNRLTVKRFEHSEAVSYMAAKLAALHGENADKAAVAGLLHDCCRCLEPKIQLKILKSRGILLDECEMALPAIWHGITGGIVLESELKITDTDILNAVRYHVTGRKDMTRFEQIIYIADITSGDRQFDGIETMRRLSRQNLRQAMMRSLEYTFQTLISQHKPIVKDAFEAYNYFWKNTKESDL